MSRRRLRHGGRRAGRGTPVNLERLQRRCANHGKLIPTKLVWRVYGYPNPGAHRVDTERRLAESRRHFALMQAERQAVADVEANANIASVKAFCAAASGPLTLVRVVGS